MTSALLPNKSVYDFYREGISEVTSASVTAAVGSHAWVAPGLDSARRTSAPPAALRTEVDEHGAIQETSYFYPDRLVSN